MRLSTSGRNSHPMSALRNVIQILPLQRCALGALVRLKHSHISLISRALSSLPLKKVMAVKVTQLSGNLDLMEPSLISTCPVDALDDSPNTNGAINLVSSTKRNVLPTVTIGSTLIATLFNQNLAAQTFRINATTSTAAIVQR
jgi:hypothetical protein